MDKIMNYNRPFYIFLLLLSLPSMVTSQDYPLAPEVWSEPVRIDTFSRKYSFEYSASFTPNMDTIYYQMHGEVYTSRLVDSIWQTPERLSDNVNWGILRNPSISKDGKRIYYSAWGGYGSWDLWYNEWDDSLNDWGPARNMGPVINSPGIEWYLYEVSKDTIYTINSNWGSDAPGLYVFNHSRNEWVCVDSFCYHPLGAGNIEGMSITGDRKKLYFSRWSFLWPDKKGTELCVCYWDTLKNNWGNPYFLNINSEAYQPDTTKNIWRGGGESYPWISPDGKTLIFASDRDEIDGDEIDLYISHLLVDENGDTVTTTIEKNNKINIKEYQLYSNYPNPFNSTTTISFNLPRREVIHLSIYNLLGEEVAQLIGGKVYEKGKHIIQWDVNDIHSSGLSSGIYFCRLKGKNFHKTIKMLYLK